MASTIRKPDPAIANVAPLARSRLQDDVDDAHVRQTPEKIRFRKRRADEDDVVPGRDSNLQLGHL